MICSKCGSERIMGIVELDWVITETSARLHPFGNPDLHLIQARCADCDNIVDFDETVEYIALLEARINALINYPGGLDEV